MYASLVSSLSAHSPSLLLRRPRAHRRAVFSFFPLATTIQKNIFLSNLGVMLFQVWVINKLGQTLHVSELMQKAKQTGGEWMVVGVSKKESNTRSVN